MPNKNGYKFIVVVTLLFMVPFLLLARHFFSGVKALQRNDTLNYLELRTRAGAGIISGVLNLNYSLSRSPGAPSVSGAAELKRELGRRVKENPFIYSELALLSASGSELARFSAEKNLKIPVEYGKSPMFSEAKASTAPAGAVEYGTYTPPALVLVEPVPGSGSKPQFYVAGRLSLAYLGEVVRLMGRNSSGNLGLVDGGGQIIADSKSMSILKPGLKAPPQVLRMLSDCAAQEYDNLSGQVRLNGRAYLVSVSNVGGSKWWMYEIVNADSLRAGRSFSWARRVFFSGICIIIILGVMSYFLALQWVGKGPGTV